MSTLSSFNRASSRRTFIHSWASGVVAIAAAVFGLPKTVVACCVEICGCELCQNPIDTYACYYSCYGSGGCFWSWYSPTTSVACAECVVGDPNGCTEDYFPTDLCNNVICSTMSGGACQ
jgi:hypothetical protein